MGTRRTPPRDQSKWRHSYPPRAKAVRAKAYANPQTRCARCGFTYAEGVARWGKRGAAWQAGHVDPALGSRSPLRPEHAHCNMQAGGREGARIAHARRNDERIERIERIERNERRSPHALADPGFSGGATPGERQGARLSLRSPRGVIGVVGPPCSGKSTYVREHATPGDVVIDFDAIARAIGSPKEHDHAEPFVGMTCAARDALIERFGRARNAQLMWVIATHRRQLAQWGVTEVVVVDTSIEECLRRARDAGRTPDVFEVIRSWRD